MQVPKLRDYQLKVLTDLDAQLRAGVDSALIVLPTGAGKTILAGGMVDSLFKNQRVWFLVHREELIEQTALKFQSFGLDVGYVTADRNYNSNHRTTLCMIQTLKNKIAKFPLDLLPDVIIVDESHRIAAKTYTKLISEIKARKKIILLGLTATPKRLDGRGLSDAFKVLIPGPSVRQLIEIGSLCPYLIKAPPNALNLEGIKKTMGEYDQRELTRRIEEADFFGDVVLQYQKFLGGKQNIVFAQNIAHSMEITELFKRAGIAAAHVDADTPKSERKEIIEAFRKKELQVLSNVYLFAEGVDVPDLDGISMARPTASEAMYQQMCGRALRPAPGKIACLIDHVRNWETHGFPCMEREWLLHYPRKKIILDNTLFRECPKCYTAVHISKLECPSCGYVFPPAEKDIFEEVQFMCYDPSGLVLQFKTKDERKRYINNELSKCHTLDNFVKLAIRAGMKPAWGRMQFVFRQRSRHHKSNQGGS